MTCPECGTEMEPFGPDEIICPVCGHTENAENDDDTEEIFVLDEIIDII